jgi:diketogulonate reductase-like aldo/keto reductase
MKEMFKLNNGLEIPQIGFGTYPMNGEILVSALKSAKEIGYKLFDTSPAYGNEMDLAKGLYIRKIRFLGNVSREKYIIQSKLFLNHCITRKEITGLKESLKRLNTDYIDIYLMHWADPETFVDNWKAMEKFYKDGLVKTIGVSNMEQHHLEKILDSCEVVPSVNQVEVTPIFTQKPLIAFCNQNKIHVEAYSPFARMHEKIFNNQILKDIALKHNKKITQVILKWNIQQGRSVIPKSQTPERLKDNLDIYDFELSGEDLNMIDSINENFRVRFHPDIYPREWREKNAKN